MAFLALFRIKNPGFPFGNYGLLDNTFSVDITENLNSSKAVKFTEYPLLDGTTRIDSVSRAPGTLNFQGKIGDVYHSPNGVQSTVVANENETRTKRFVKLLEDLRDGALVLDIITETKTFENYLIENVSFTVAQFGVITINFSMKEFIAFGSEITAMEFEPAEHTESSRSDYYLNTLTMRNFTTPQELFDSIYEVITNSDIVEPYMIRMGSSLFGFNPDITIPNISIEKPELDVNITKTGLFNFNHRYDRTYTPAVVTDRSSTAVYTSGNVVGDLNLKITLPTLERGSLVTQSTITRNDVYDWYGDGAWNYKPASFEESGKYNITLSLYENENVKKTIVTKDILVTPKYSEYSNGVNPTSYVPGSFDNDLMLSTTANPINKEALSFIKKTSDSNIYQMIPNLLGDTSLGYLYPVKYIEMIPANYGVRYTTYRYVLGFIYFHPELVKRIVTLINTFNTTPGNLLYGKRINWW